MKRAQLWSKAVTESWDLIVIGGGITGAGVAREAVRRGLKTLLVEQRDYAWGTSSRSSKMVHGGLRYIAQGDIRLTWHSLTERERLLREAPGLVSRMGYWFAHYRGVFPGRFMFGVLLVLYDLLAGVRDHRYFPRLEFLRRIPGYRPEQLTGASRYTDALVDDARLVLRVLDEAKAEGVTALNYAKVANLLLDNGRVRGVVLQDELTGATAELSAKVVVNATGAWADRLRQRLVNESRVRPQRGSHIVVPAERLPVKEAIIFMHDEDQRPLFIYPWEGRTLIGTTDLDHRADLDEEASMTIKELDYILAGANKQFPEARLERSDIIASFSGVRPIVASGAGRDPSKERRDHSVWNDGGLITVTGGKLTTFRLIALDALRLAEPYLPGLKIKDSKEPVFRQATSVLVSKNIDVPRLLGRFGFRAADLVKESPANELVTMAGVNTLWAEIRWALRHEQVEHLDDLLLRRTRIGILVEKGGEQFLSAIKPLCASELGWDDARWSLEVERYRDIWQRHYSLPAEAACA